MTHEHIFQLLGLVMITLGLGMIREPQSARKLFEEFEKQFGLIFIMGIMALVFGYLMVLVRPINFFITLLGWMGMVKGCLMLMAPSKVQAMCKAIAKDKKSFPVYGWVILGFGFLSLLIGFIALPMLNGVI